METHKQRSASLVQRKRPKRRTAATRLVIFATAMMLLASFVPTASAQQRGGERAEQVERVERDSRPTEGRPSSPDIDRPGRPTVNPPTIGNNNSAGAFVDLDVTVMLEGSLVNPSPPGSTLMRTSLVSGPTSDLVPATDAVNYGLGTTMDEAAVKARQGNDALVDWVKIEVVNAADPTVPVYEMSAVLEADGDVMSATNAGQRLQVLLNDGLYQIVIRHWSHLPVISPIVTPSNGTLAFDFSAWRTDPRPGFPATQKDMGNGLFAMFLGNGHQDATKDEFDINGNDKGVWSVDNGKFSMYLRTDYNMDGDINADDRIARLANNGVFNFPFTPAGGVVINEVEAQAVPSGDWIELHNPTAVDFDLSGYTVSNAAGATYAIPSGTTVAAGDYFTIDRAVFGFNLSSTGDTLSLSAPGDALVDSVAWTSQNSSTLGRCADGVGGFVETVVGSKGSSNICGPALFHELSGLDYQPKTATTPAYLWGVEDTGHLRKLVWDAPSNAWLDVFSKLELERVGSNASTLDTEGITLTDNATAANGSSTIYVASERDKNLGSGTRNIIYQYVVPAHTTDSLQAANQWDLTAQLPTSANKGLEAIAWIPDSFLTASGFVDESGPTDVAYTPYTDAVGQGLFFVGVEEPNNDGNGLVHVIALRANGAFVKVATIETSLAGVMGLHFDEPTGELWAVCDSVCSHDADILRINSSGKFAKITTVTAPTSLPVSAYDLEGFAIADASTCAGNQREVYWSDDRGDVLQGQQPEVAVYTTSTSCSPH